MHSLAPPTPFDCELKNTCPHHLEALTNLASSRNRLEAIAANVPGIVYQYRQDPDGDRIFPYISSRVRDYLGLEPGDVMRDPGVLFDRIVDIDRRSFDESIAQSRIKGTRWEWEGRVSTPTGIRWMSGSSRPYRDSGGNVLWNGILLDITERKRYESELMEARAEAAGISRFKSALITNLNHEFRTPLTGIMGLAELLASDEDLEPELQKEWARLIYQSGNRLFQTLSSVLDMAQIEAENVDISLEPVDVLARIRDVRLAFDSIADANDTYVSIEAPEPPVIALCDNIALSRVLRNLLSNAIKFTEHGQVRIIVKADDKVVTIQVCDSGIGISDEFLPYVFDEFRQESNGDNRHFEGAGLGLTITRKLVEEMGGEIAVQSEMGRGSCFTVKLPVFTGN